MSDQNKMKLSSQQLSSRIIQKISKKTSTHTQKGLNRLSALLYKMPTSQRSSLLDQLSEGSSAIRELNQGSTSELPSSKDQTPSIRYAQHQDVDSTLNHVESRPKISFHQLSLLPPDDFRKIFNGVKLIVWLKALKIAEPEFKEFVLSTVSVRIKGDLEEELAYLGPIRLSDAQEAQEHIIQYAYTLEEQGEIQDLLIEDDEPWL